MVTWLRSSPSGTLIPQTICFRAEQFLIDMIQGDFPRKVVG